MRVDDPASFRDAWVRLRALLQSPDIRAERSEAHDTVLVEGFIPGREVARSEEHTSELQSHSDLVCRLLLEKKKPKDIRAEGWIDRLPTSRGRRNRSDRGFSYPAARSSHSDRRYSLETEPFPSHLLRMHST